MSFMQREIYAGDYFRVNTSHGTEFVPADVVGNKPDNVHVSELRDYLSGKPDDEDETIEVETGWLARMSAPGYLDCTDWGAYETEQDAEDALTEMFGDDEDDSDD